MQSSFIDKQHRPTAKDLEDVLGKTISLWKEIQEFVVTFYPDAVCEWNFSGEKYGWSFRIKDKKRVIIYLLPRDGFFKAAFVFGEKALEKISAGDVADSIKKELKAAKKYAEGKGIRIDIRKKQDTRDIKQLVLIKLSH